MNSRNIFRVIAMFAIFSGLMATVLSGCVSTAVYSATPDTEEILEEYMESAGYEYEDTLVLDLSERFGREVVIYDSKDLSTEEIETRDGNKVIVEKCYGEVISRDGDGMVLHPYDEDFGYISYRRCKDIREGTLIITYLVYNPETAYLDDIIERYDCVASHELED